MNARSHAYAVRLRWTGAHAGPTRTYAGYSREHEVACGDKPALRASADPAFRGDASAYNPEELLVAALASCHFLSYVALCARAGIAVAGYDDDASGTMEERAGAGRFTAVVLRPRVTLAADASATDVARALALHHEAHETCFVANSVNFPVTCEPVVTAGAPA